MMNLYREQEKEPRRTFKQVIKDGVDGIKQTIETSSLNRNKMIKTITKEIKKLDASDVETMKKIHKLVVSYDLCSSVWGNTVKEEDMKAFVQKLQENGTLQEIEENIQKEMKSYELEREKQIGDE